MERKLGAGQGSAWSKTNEVRYVYDGMAVLQERDGNNAELVTYTRGLDLSGSMQGAGGIGGLLARTEHSATASLLASSSYYHSDAGGNITAMTDSSGNVVAKYLYDPFGNLLAKSGAMADVNRYRFSSKEVHANSGLYYYGFRFYEPNLQRWLNEDPMGETYDANLYRSVYNNPANFIDPNGLWGIGFGSFINVGWGNPTIQFGDPGWMDSEGERHGGTPPSEQQPLDPNSFLAQHGADLSIFGGELPGDFIANKGKKVCKDSVETLASLTPVGGAEGALAAGVKEIEAINKAKALKNCEQLAAKAPKLTKWGYEGSKEWREAAKLLEKGGTLEKLRGKIPSKEEALKLLEKAGAKVERIEGPHTPPNPHNYPHINYTTPSGTKGTIQIGGL